jgi:hypothetical protein
VIEMLDIDAPVYREAPENSQFDRLHRVAQVLHDLCAGPP